MWRKRFFESLEQEDPNLAINIRNFMFTFEDLLGVADVAIREWLGAMDKKVLAMALKGASNDLKDHIFRSMSSRAADMLKEDMEALGPVRSKDVAQAQQESVALLRTAGSRRESSAEIGRRRRICRIAAPERRGAGTHRGICVPGSGLRRSNACGSAALAAEAHVDKPSTDSEQERRSPDRGGPRGRLPRRREPGAQGIREKPCRAAEAHQ